MRPSRLPALLIALLALLALPAPPASAGVPWPINFTIPSHVTLVGHGPAGPDSVVGHVECVLRDFANNPVPGSVVMFDFSACTDLSIATDQRDPRLFVNCTTRIVAAVTDLAGRAQFTVLGSGTGGPTSPPQAFRIYADGVLLGSPSVAVLERDGVGGLTLADLSYWARDYFSGANPARADLDGMSGVTIADLSIWAAAYFSGNNTEPVGTLCP